jgi:hypothetical protein
MNKMNKFLKPAALDQFKKLISSKTDLNAIEMAKSSF